MTRLILIMLVASAAAANPGSFTCDQHHQTFIKIETIYPQGQCFDVYTHQSPAHRVTIACAK